MYFGEKIKTPTNAEEITAVQKMKILSRPLKRTREESKCASAISKISESSVFLLWFGTILQKIAKNV